MRTWKNLDFTWDTLQVEVKPSQHESSINLFQARFRCYLLLIELPLLPSTKDFLFSFKVLALYLPEVKLSRLLLKDTMSHWRWEMAGGMNLKLFNSTRFNIDKKNKNSTRLTLYRSFHTLACWHIWAYQWDIVATKSGDIFFGSIG